MEESLEVLTKPHVKSDGHEISVIQGGTAKVYRVRDDSRPYTQVGREELRLKTVDGSRIWEEIGELHRELRSLLLNNNLYSLVRDKNQRDTIVLTLNHLVEEAEKSGSRVDLSKPLDEFSAQSLWTITKRYGLSMGLCYGENCGRINFGKGWYDMPGELEKGIFEYFKTNKPTSGYCPECEYKLVGK